MLVRPAGTGWRMRLACPEIPPETMNGTVACAGSSQLTVAVPPDRWTVTPVGRAGSATGPPRPGRAARPDPLVRREPPPARGAPVAPRPPPAGGPPPGRPAAGGIVPGGIGPGGVVPGGRGGVAGGRAGVAG